MLPLVAVVAVGSALRWLVAAGTGLSEFDPWRHLKLIENVRSGAGFTLFDGQPYLWYNGLWYRLAALAGPAERVRWLSGALSAVSVAVFFHFLLRTERSLTAAVAGGLLIAAWGPCIVFTSTYGSEAFALLALLLACLAATYPAGPLPPLAAGALFGVAVLSRVNFLFGGLLLLPLLKGRRRLAPFVAAAAAVVAVGWLQNHATVRSHPYLFTWDGIATASGDYGVVSTLVPQLHPDVVRATRELYGGLAPNPFDPSRLGRIAWGNLAFLALGLGCVLATRRPALALATLAPLAYFTFFASADGTNFLRHYLAVFPPLFVGIAVVCERLRAAAAGALAPLLWPSLLVGALLTGLPQLHPRTAPPLEAVTPPPGMLSRDRYLVNSGFYHPESLVYRYPDKRFIGMPLDPSAFDDFSRRHPDYKAILWHPQFSVQQRLFEHLTGPGGYRVAAAAPNAAGMRYLILERD